MDTKAIIANIDSEISRLQHARAALAALDSTPASAPVKHRGRPKGTGVKKTTAATPKRKGLSAEARARIAEAQKKRWAKMKKTALK